jgi:glycosyltransferase involved in cell wall biosynthesis
MSDPAARGYAQVGPIAILSHSHPSLTKGGAEIAAYTLFTGLMRLGCDVTFIAACSEASRSGLSLASARERVVFTDPTAFDSFHHLATPATVKSVLSVLPRHTRVVNFHHFIHFGLGVLREVGANLGAVSVLTMHELLSICHHHGQMITRGANALCTQATPTACTQCFPEHTRQEFALRRRAFLEAYRCLDGFISPSRFMLERYVSWGLDRERLKVIENGLPHREHVSPGRQPGPYVFGFFGQINPFKGVDTILRAAEALSRTDAASDRIRIRIHGNFIGQSQSFIDRFMKLLEELPFLSFSGPYDNSQVGRLMADCDYVLVPSVWWENSPVVIQEAYAARRPVICTGIGGMAEKVVDEVSGLHFRRNDHTDLVSQMLRAADDATFQRLQAGIPRVMGSEGMALKYLHAYLQFRARKLSTEEDQDSDNESRAQAGA